MVNIYMINESYKTPLLWANLLDEYKLASSLGEFKRKTKDLKCKTLVCWLCQTYHQGMGYIWNKLFILIVKSNCRYL